MRGPSSEAVLAALHEASWSRDPVGMERALLRWFRYGDSDSWRSDVAALLNGGPTVLEEVAAGIGCDPLQIFSHSAQNLASARADWLSAQHCCDADSPRGQYTVARVGRKLHLARVARGAARVLRAHAARGRRA